MVLLAVALSVAAGGAAHAAPASATINDVLKPPLGEGASDKDWHEWAISARAAFELVDWKGEYANEVGCDVVDVFYTPIVDVEVIRFIGFEGAPEVPAVSSLLADCDADPAERNAIDTQAVSMEAMPLALPKSCVTATGKGKACVYPSQQMGRMAASFQNLTGGTITGRSNLQYNSSYPSCWAGSNVATSVSVSLPHQYTIAVDVSVNVNAAWAGSGYRFVSPVWTKIATACLAW